MIKQIHLDIYLPSFHITQPLAATKSGRLILPSQQCPLPTVTEHNNKQRCFSFVTHMSHTPLYASPHLKMPTTLCIELYHCFLYFNRWLYKRLSYW